MALQRRKDSLLRRHDPISAKKEVDSKWRLRVAGKLGQFEMFPGKPKGTALLLRVGGPQSTALAQAQSGDQLPQGCFEAFGEGEGGRGRKEGSHDWGQSSVGASGTDCM